MLVKSTPESVEDCNARQNAPFRSADLLQYEVSSSIVGFRSFVDGGSHDTPYNSMQRRHSR